MIVSGSVNTFCSKITLPASSTMHTDSLSPTHQDPRNAPSHRSFLDARGRTDLDPLIVAKGDAHSASKAELPPRYTIFGSGSRPRPSRLRVQAEAPQDPAQGA